LIGDFPKDKVQMERRNLLELVRFPAEMKIVEKKLGSKSEEELKFFIENNRFLIK
jgi:hypothetical protein